MMKDILHNFKGIIHPMIILIDVISGVWLAGVFIYVFWSINSGSHIFEPDSLIVRVELIGSMVITTWYLWQVPYWLIRILKKKEEA